MVGNVNFNGMNNVGYYSRDLENVAKYVIGTTLVTPESNPMSEMGSMLLIGGGIETFKLGTQVWKNRNDLSGFWTKGMNNLNADYAYKKGLFSNGGFKKLDTYKTIWNNYSANQVIEHASPLAADTKYSQKVRDLYRQANEAAELAKSGKTNVRRAIAVANAKMAEANQLLHVEKMNTVPVKTWGKITRFLGKYSGYNYLNGQLKTLAVKSPIVSSLYKYGKGNALFLGITGGIELFTQVIPAFTQLGAVSGTKQLFKSTAKTAASIGGWTAGMAAGAAIGSVFLGPGTVIGGLVGGLIGMIGGSLGSWAATKATESIVGKNELDIAKEEQAKQVAQQAGTNAEAKNELITLAAQKLRQEGLESEDAKIVAQSLQQLGYLQNDAQAPAMTAATQPQPNASKEATTANPYATAQNQPNPNYNFFANQSSQMDYMNKDLMAMDAGIA